VPDLIALAQHRMQRALDELVAQRVQNQPIADPEASRIPGDGDAW
jgi:hypothetical protein